MSIMLAQQLKIRQLQRKLDILSQSSVEIGMEKKVE
jgi:hypothetical protein